MFIYTYNTSESTLKTRRYHKVLIYSEAYKLYFNYNKMHKQNEVSDRSDIILYVTILTVKIYIFNKHRKNIKNIYLIKKTYKKMRFLTGGTKNI